MQKSIVARVLERAVEIQQIPAPTFSEHRRAAYIHERFIAEGLQEVETDELGNVYGRLPGAGEKPPLIVSAHSDTVFPEGTDLTIRREEGKIAGPGIGDNSLGVAALFSLLWAGRKKKKPFSGDLWLVANVGEEGLGNLRGMRAVVDRFGNQVLAYLVLEGMALGQVYHHALDVQRYRITIKTSGGHSWVDYGRPSAINVLAGIVTRLSEIPLPTHPRTTLNVGVFSGGTSVNTIAARAHLELDLRSESRETLQAVAAQVESIVAEANRRDIRTGVEMIGERPSGKIPTDHPLVQLGVRSLEAQSIQARFNTGSTDANIPLSRGLPSICLGITSGCGAHTAEEFIYTQPVEKGLAQLKMVVEGAFKELAGVRLPR